MNESEEAELLFFETFSHDNSEVSLFSKQLNDYIHAVHEEDCELFVRIRSVQTFTFTWLMAVINCNWKYFSRLMTECLEFVIDWF